MWVVFQWIVALAAAAAFGIVVVAAGVWVVTNVIFPGKASVLLEDQRSKPRWRDADYPC